LIRCRQYTNLPLRSDTLIVLFSLIRPIFALPNVTAIQIVLRDYSIYPSTYTTFGRSVDKFSFTPDRVDNSSIDDLNIGVTSAGLVAYADNATASDIFCYDHGRAVEEGLGYKNLTFSFDANTKLLGY
jgi:hypothetical protein